MVCEKQTSVLNSFDIFIISELNSKFKINIKAAISNADNLFSKLIPMHYITPCTITIMQSIKWFTEQIFNKEADTCKHNNRPTL